MKYVISEQQFDKIINKYLDSQDFAGDIKYFDHEKHSLTLFTSSNDTTPELKSMFQLEREKLIDLIEEWFEKNSGYDVKETKLAIYI